MQGNEAAQEPGQIIADRQAQPRTAILAADIDIRLFKGLEDQIMLLRGMPIPVSCTSKAIHFCAADPS